MSSARPLRCGVASTYLDFARWCPTRDATGTFIDQLDRARKPAVAQLEIVLGLDRLVGLGVVVGLERHVFVVVEQAAEDDRLVGEAELVVVGPGRVPDQVGRAPVLRDAFLRRT